MIRIVEILGLVEQFWRRLKCMYLIQNFIENESCLLTVMEFSSFIVLDTSLLFLTIVSSSCPLNVWTNLSISIDSVGSNFLKYFLCFTVAKSDIVYKWNLTPYQSMPFTLVVFWWVRNILTITFLELPLGFLILILKAKSLWFILL